MATNPNAIFGEALATGPRQIPLSDLQQQIAATRQTQAQTANIGSQMAQRQQETLGLQQQNTLRQRQLEDEQAVRDAIAHNTTSIPVTAPNANIPTPGTDNDGNPLPLDLGYHQIAAKGAVQAPHVDYNGAYAELVGKGRFAAAETMLKSIQDRRAKDLDNSKAQTALFETQNNRRNELAASVVNAPPEQQAAIAAQVGPQLEQEQLIAPGSGASFGPNEANVLYRSSSGAKDPIRAANASLGVSEAQAQELAATADEKREQARQFKLANDAAEQFLRNPNAVLGNGGMIDGLGLNADDAKRLKGQLVGLYQMPGTPQEKATAVKGAIQGAVNSAQQEARSIREKTNPAVLKAEINKEIAARVGTQRALAGTGPFASITDQAERNRAIEDSNKLDNDYADKVGAARQLQDFVAAAQSGNKAAPGLIPIAEVRQLVNRVTRNELQSVSSGAGSAWDRIQGKIGSLVEGQPIPPDILRDINTISGTMENAAGRTYDLKRQALGRNHGIAPPPRINIPPSGPAPQAAPPTAQHKVGDTVRLKGGQTVTIKAIHPDGTFDY